MSENLHTRIARLILEQIEAGNIDPAQVRQIIVGLSSDCQSINIWQYEEWENYDSHSDERAIAEIDNRDWVTQLDAIGFSFSNPGSNQATSRLTHLPSLGFSFIDEAHQQAFFVLLSQKIIEIDEALKQIAREQLLGELSQLVGLMGQRISNSGYADLVCIYHPQGIDLLPVNDRPLPGFESLYGHMSLVDDGVIVFYTDEDEMEDLIRHYLFSEMDFFEVDDNEVVFQLSNGLQIELGAGHTHQEWGGLGSKEIEHKLITHFKTRSPQLYFDIDSAPAIDDASAWHQWQNLFKHFFRSKLSGAIRACLKTGGIKQVEAFLAALELSAEEKSTASAIYLQYYFTQNQYADLIPCFNACDPDSLASDDWDSFYRAMMMQGQLREIFEISQANLSPKPDDYKSILHLSYYVIASVQLGYQEDFVAILAATKNYRKTAFYVAKLLVTSDDSLNCISNIVSDRDYKLEYAEKDFAFRPELLTQLQFYLELRKNTVHMDPQLKNFFTESAEKSEVMAFEKVFGERWVSQSVTMLKQVSEIPLTQPVKKGFFINGEHWVCLKKGFARMQVDGANCQLTQILESDRYYAALDKVENIIYAISNKTIDIFICEQDLSPRLLSQTFSFLDQPNSISVSNGIAVIGDGEKLVVLDVSNPALPKHLACISLTPSVGRYVRCNCLLLKDQYLYLGFDDQGVGLVDLANPLAPNITSYVPCNISFDVIDVDQRTLVAAGKNGVVAINFNDPHSPKVIDVLSVDVDYLFQVAPMSFIGGGNTSWCGVQFQAATQKLILDIWPLFDSYYGQKAIIPNQNGFFICDDDNAIYLQFYSEPALKIPAEAEAKEKAAAWIREVLAQYQSESSEVLGCVKVSNYSDVSDICLYSQQSLPSIGYSSGERVSWSDLWGIDLIDQNNWCANAYKPVLQKFFTDALIKLLQTEFTHLISGQCYINADEKIISQIINKGEWKPARREIQSIIEVPLATRLKDYNTWTVYARKCDQDAELKQELYALAKEGYANALQVVRRRFEQDEDDSIAVMLFAIEEYSAFFWLDFIEEYAHRQDVKQVCERLYSRLIQSLNADEENVLDWAEGLIQVTIMLGKQNQSEIDPLIDRLLSAPGVDYQHYDLVIKLLDSKKDVSSFASIIHQAIKAMAPRDNRLPGLAEQLFHAGVFEIPEGLLVQAAPEKDGEQYASVKLGIQFLDEDIPEYDQCRIERLFTGKMLLDNVRQGVPAGQSLWPQSLALEPWPQSWAYLLKSVLSQMDINAELPGFIQALGSRLNHPADRAIFAALFKALIESKDQANNLQSMINLVQALPGDAAWEDLHKIRKNTEANLAWQANAEGNLEQAKEITQRLLAEGYESAYLFFLEARLAWKETGDPAVAIELALPRLKGLHGGTAKAHFINLVGCAYDALGKFTEALAQFKQAAEMSPETVIYFDNIAEIHDKMGDAEKALHSALEARRRGSKAAIVESIIKKYSKVDSGS